MFIGGTGESLFQPTPSFRSRHNDERLSQIQRSGCWVPILGQKSHRLLKYGAAPTPGMFLDQR